MDTFAPVAIAAVVAFALGAALAALLTRAVLAPRMASLCTERYLLDRRCGELERDAAHAARQDADLAPLRVSLDQVARQVTVLERDRVQQFGELGERLGEVSRTAEALRAQTASLAGSLQSSAVRGTWGEAQLRRVVEHAGMLRHVDFEEQSRVVNAQGAAVRPDLVVRLPGERRLVIDAKVPLSAFLRAQGEAVAPHEREALLREHAQALRRHVDALSAKEYWSAFPTAPELVVAFLPADAVLAAALTADPALYDDAQSRRVVLASPATLLALLRTVAYAWRQDALADDARELLALGQQLYARLGTLGQHTATLGASLRRSVDSYNAFVGALESRVLVTARRMGQVDHSQPVLQPPQPVDAAPRPLTAAELLDALEPQVARPDVDLADPPTQPPGRRRSSA